MKLSNFIIYADMDGTSLTDWDRGPVVPERNLEGMARFMREGGAFSIATGRQYEDSMSFFPEHFFNAPSVHANGAAIWDGKTDSIMKITPIAQSCKKELVEYTRQYKNLWLAPADDREIYEIIFNDERDGTLRDTPKIRGQISIEEFYSRDFVKACFVLGDPADMPRLKRDYEAMECSKLLNSSTSSPIYFECYDRTVDKGRGVLEARRLSGNQDKTLVCMGDYFNDMSMLLAADIAVCPANAPQEIKDVCKIVTCGNNEGAVGDLIEILERM